MLTKIFSANGSSVPLSGMRILVLRSTMRLPRCLIEMRLRSHTNSVQSKSEWDAAVMPNLLYLIVPLLGYGRIANAGRYDAGDAVDPNAPYGGGSELSDLLSIGVGVVFVALVILGVIRDKNIRDFFLKYVGFLVVMVLIVGLLPKEIAIAALIAVVVYLYVSSTRKQKNDLDAGERSVKFPADRSIISDDCEKPREIASEVVSSQQSTTTTPLTNSKPVPPPIINATVQAKISPIYRGGRSTITCPKCSHLNWLKQDGEGRMKCTACDFDWQVG